MIELMRFQRVLAFFAHPDDETLAAGATISKMTRMGIEVHAAIPATGVYSRRNTLHKEALDAEFERLRANCHRALGILGISASRITLGDFSDNELDKHSLLELVHWLEEVVEKVQPALIMTHHRFCTNIDHRYCHEAAVVAARPGIDRHISLWCGEIPSSTGNLRPAQWEPNLYIGVSEDDVAKKIQAMQSYSGEAREDPHPRSPEVLRALAKMRGSEAGFMWAEAFMAQRIFG